MNIRNANALREAEAIVRAFEEANHITSEEMLACPEGDARLSAMDGFDLMDWNYALEQIKALRPQVGNIHAVAFQPVVCASFSYARSSPRELANTPESEYQLVA